MSPITPNAPADPNAPLNVPPSPAKRKRRKWPYVILAILLVLLLLVALAPTIASTAPVRAFVLGKVNNNLNGRVAVSGWSLGWMSGINVNGVKVYDENNAEIADVPRIRTDLTLIDAARGNYSLGNTEIDIANFVARIDENGKSNFERLTTKGPSKPPSKSAGELPNVSGKLSVNIMQGTIETAGNPPVHVGPSTASLVIPDINKPIDNNVKLAFRVGEETPGNVTLAGTVDAVENNKLDLDKLAADQKVNIDNVNLAAAAPFLKQAKLDAQLGGVANGALHATAQGITGISTDGELVVTNLLFGGPILKGDTFRTQRVAIPLQVTRTVVDPNTTVIKIEKLGVQMAEATISVTGQVTQEALARVLDNQPPGQDGKIDVVVNVPDLGNIANQLPHTLQLAEGVQIKGGTFNQTSSIALTKEQVALSQRVDLAASGTRNGQPIALKPIHVEADAQAIPTSSAGGIPDIRNIKLGVQSDFATVTGGGESIANLKLDGGFDLDKLSREVRQFSDLGEMQLAGTGSFSVATKGDVMKVRDGQPIDASVSARLDNVNITGIKDQPPLKIARLAFDTKAQMVGTRTDVIDTVDVQSLTLQTGEQSAPVVDVAGTATIKVPTQTVPKFALHKFDIPSLAQAQEQFGAFVPALARQNLVVRDGKLSIRTAGSYDGKTLALAEPLVVTLPGLTILRNNQPVLSGETIQVNLNGTVSAAEGIAANLTDLSVTSSSNLFTVSKSGPGPLAFELDRKTGAIRGNGALSISSDLKRANDLAQAFGGPAPAKPASGGAGELRSGRLDATIRLVKADKPETTINIDGNITDLSVTTNTTPIENEKVGITLAARSPDDLSGVSASGKIISSFATTSISDAKVKLAGGFWQMLQSAAIDVNVPDLAKLQSVANAFSPASSAPVISGDGSSGVAEAPLEPLRITGGSMGVKLTVARDTSNNTTNVTVADGRINALKLRRGETGAEYRFDREAPITFKLNAAVQATDDPAKSVTEQVQSITINDLAGDMRVASLTMPEPIKITGPLNKPNANGAIKLDGSLDQLMPLLAVLQGKAAMPYGGDFSLTQKVASVQQNDELVLNLEGRVIAQKFRVLDDRGQTAFEDAIEMKNNVGVYVDKKIATVRTLTINMPQSNALAMDLTGRVLNWDDARQIRDAKLNLKYDLEKLWQIVFPMLDPQMQKTYKELKIAGKFEKQFTVSGAFPARPTMAESLRSLNADGGLAVELLDLPQGLTIQNFDMPFKMDKGVVRTLAGKVDPTPPAPREDTHDGKSNKGLAGLLTGRSRSAAEEQKRQPAKAAPTVATPRTAWCNQGALDFDGITIDMTHPSPLISIAGNKKLLRSVRLNPVLADTLGGANLLFKNANEATGMLDVVVVECNEVPAGKLIKEHPDARAAIVFSVNELKLDGPVPGVMSQVLNLGGQGIQGNIRNGAISLADGIATSDFAINLAQQVKEKDPKTGRERAKTVELPLKFAGSVVLASGALRDFFVNIPSELLPNQLGGRDIRKFLPNGIRVPFTGTTDKFTFDFQKAVTDSIGQNLLSPEGAGGILGDLLGGKKKDQNKNR